MTTRVGFFNKNGKDIIEALYESEGSIRIEEGEEGYYKNFYPTNVDIEAILERYNCEYYFYSEPGRRWLQHKEEVKINDISFDKYFIYKPSSFTSYTLPKKKHVLDQAYIDGLTRLAQYHNSNVFVDGWFYQFVYNGYTTELTISLDPEVPLIKLDISDDTVEECCSKVAGAISAFAIEWEYYLASKPEGSAVVQYLMKNEEDTELLPRNCIPLVTRVGPTYSLLMQSLPVNEHNTQNFTSKDDTCHLPFVYALKERLDQFINEVWLVNNPID